MADHLFTDREMAALIRRAAELQTASDQGTHSLAEIQEIAAQVDIDPAGALAPYTISYVATLPNVGIGSALALTSAFFLAGAVLLLFFADTSRKPLVESP